MSGLSNDEDTSVAAAEVVEELTEEELVDRHRLELKVERAFREAGLALAQLRNRRLYRSTHSSFEAYCRDRFGMQRAYPYRLIDAAMVVDNLLPTTESQCRPLARLEPDVQRQAWNEAVEATGGKVPTASTVKNIVQRLKERGTTPPPIPFQKGDVLLIRGLGNLELRKYDGQWAIALCINEYTVNLAIDGLDVAVKPQFLEPVDPKYWAEIRAVNARITRLQFSCNLDPADDAVLEVLRRRTCFTQRQMLLLERMEQDYATA